MRGLIGKKVGMTQVFNNEGGLIPENCFRSRSLYFLPG
ncbi:MAG: hypothetical protein CM1200mP1_15660 [Candidatus Neomarinimicrobiota bacterium]|nr:MAG: hypothetical protein CM1200mP1_15660 [Candidatus Neomarinimicrobiota bacterium]